MLRIAILCEFPTTNGGERSMLAALDRLRSEVQPVFLAPPGGSLSAAIRASGGTHIGFDVRDSRGQRRPADEVERELSELVQSTDPHLLHANSLSMGRLSGRLASRLGRPCTAHLRDILRLNRQVVDDLNRNRQLFAVSAAVRDFHIAQGLNASRTLVLYNGVDTCAFQPPADDLERSRLRVELGLPADAMLALTIGQIGLRKGLDVLIAAASGVATACPRLHFIIVGERYSAKAEAIEYEQSLHSHLQSQSLADRFRWLGLREDVPRLMRSADLLIHPARQEPFGRVLLEAAASGLPIIATRVGGTGEMLTDGESAVLISPDSSEQLAAAVIDVVADPALRAKLGTTARQHVLDRFAIDRAAKELLNAWQRALVSE